MCFAHVTFPVSLSGAQVAFPAPHRGTSECTVTRVFIVSFIPQNNYASQHNNTELEALNTHHETADKPESAASSQPR